MATVGNPALDSILGIGVNRYATSFIAAATSALGVSTSTVGGGILSAIGGGLSSLFGVNQKETAEQEQKYKLEQIRESEKLRGEEERKTSKYNIELNSAVDEYQRARKRGAFKNFGFATPK